MPPIGHVPGLVSRNSAGMVERAAPRGMKRSYVTDGLSFLVHIFPMALILPLSTPLCLHSLPAASCRLQRRYWDHHCPSHTHQSPCCLFAASHCSPCSPHRASSVLASGVPAGWHLPKEIPVALALYNQKTDAQSSFKSPNLTCLPPFCLSHSCLVL